MRWDTSELESVAADLSKAPFRVQRAADRALGRGAGIVARRLRVAATGHRYLPGLPGSVSHGRLAPLTHEIGFDKGGQGSLAHIIVRGSVNNAPVFDHTASLRQSLPEIERELADAGEDSVFGGAR